MLIFIYIKYVLLKTMKLTLRNSKAVKLNTMQTFKEVINSGSISKYSVVSIKCRFFNNK